MYRPWMNRYVGIEMEMNTVSTRGGHVTQQQIAAGMRALGVGSNVGGYGHTSGNGPWDVKTDSTCGWEVASPKLLLDENGDNDELKKTCTVLRETLAVRVDRRCGLHVHVDCSDYTWQDLQKLIALWVRYEPAFFGMLPASRHDNQWCGEIRANKWGRTSANRERLINAVLNATSEHELVAAAQQLVVAAAHRRMGQSKYVSMNLNHYWRTKRVEFRLHSGTVEYKKIKNWAIMLASLVSRVKAADAPPIARKLNQPRPEIGFSIEHVLKMIGLGETSWTEETPVAREVIAYAVARYNQHSARR